MDDPENTLLNAFLTRQIAFQHPKQITAHSDHVGMRAVKNKQTKEFKSNHPLYKFLRTGPNKFSFRNNPKSDKVTLVLKPVARSIAGSDGKAIATPQSRAVLRQGVNVDILYEPEAVAIAGPGGTAHAESDLEIIKLKAPVKITLLPFYGGAKGQSLQITESADGSTTTSIVDTPPRAATKPDHSTIYEIEHPELPTRQESRYGDNLKNIHSTALNILKLQEKAKSTGLTSSDEIIYKGYVDSLSESAQRLTKLYEGNDEETEDEDDDLSIRNRAGLSSWFARKKNSNKNKDKQKEEELKKKEEEKRKEEERQRQEEENRRKAEEKRKQEEEKDDDEESVAVNLPSEEASVAEAKPVGLAVAGIGGVASSKPIATAVVGPGGLAIARPVGTAIAGVSPDQALVPIYAEGFVVPSRKAGEKKHIHSTEYLHKIISKYHQS